MLKAESCRKD